MNNINNTDIFNNFESFTYGDDFYEKLEGYRNTNNSDNNFNNFGSITGPDYSFENIIDLEKLDLLKEKEKEFERKKYEEELKIKKIKKDIEERERKIKKIEEENKYLVDKNESLLEDKDINLDYVCVICMTDTKNCLLEPCNHVAMCISCYNSGNIKTCPCCRQNVTGMKKIFI